MHWKPFLGVLLGLFVWAPALAGQGRPSPPARSTMAPSLQRLLAVRASLRERGYRMLLAQVRPRRVTSEPEQGILDLGMHEDAETIQGAELPRGYRVWASPFYYVFGQRKSVLGAAQAGADKRQAPTTTVDALVGKPDSPRESKLSTPPGSWFAPMMGEPVFAHLEFAAFVRASELRLYHVGKVPTRVARVLVRTPLGQLVEVWRRPSREPLHGGVLRIPLSGVHTDHVLLELADWKESQHTRLDAVALVDAKGREHWVESALASIPKATFG